MFLDQGRLYSDRGRETSLTLVQPEKRLFPSMERLEDELWHDPANAEETARILLREQSGNFTPSLHSLVMRTSTIPLFEREFYGEETSTQILEAIEDTKQVNAKLLDRYLSLEGDESIDQKLLMQGITDLVVLQLLERNLHGTAEDDIIPLPVGPATESRVTLMTILRTGSKGRALLRISDKKRLGTSLPDRNNHVIPISREELAGDSGSIIPLAEMLITECLDTTSNPEIAQEIERATGVLHTKIDAQFAWIPTKDTA